MSNLLTRRKVILAKPESTYNTDPTPTEGADAILCENPVWSSAGLKMIERVAARPSLGALKQVYGGRLLQLAFGVEVKGSGTAGTAPEIGPLLRACGFDETIVASTSVTYGPVSTSLESVTFYIYEDGKRIILTGCRGNVSFTLATGGKVMAQFTFTGHEAAQTDVALASPTYNSNVPAPFIGATFTVDSYAAVINQITCDMGNNIAMPTDANASDGYGEIQITSRDVNGAIDPLDELVATEDFIGNFKSGAAMAMQTGVIGSTAGNRFAFSWPAISYRDAGPQDREGIAALNLPYGAAEATTDDEISIAFT